MQWLDGNIGGIFMYIFCNRAQLEMLRIIGVKLIKTIGIFSRVKSDKTANVGG